MVALTPGESYSKIVRWKSLQKHETIATKIDGVFVCNNWEMRGYCFTSCKRVSTHIQLNNKHKGKYRAYIATLHKDASQPQDTHTKSPYKGKFQKLKSEHTENTGEHKQTPTYMGTN